MAFLRALKRLYHIVIRRDVLGPFGISKFGAVGSGATIFRPEILDRNTNRIFIGNGTTILAGSRIQLYPIEGAIPRVVFGDNCYIGYHNSFLAGADIIIGDDVLMASNILISSENHSTDPESPIPYMNQPLKAKPVSIGDGTWIGERAMVMPGVNIGRKCIIGAGSIVTKDIPDCCVAVGSPARVVKTYDFEMHKWINVSH